MPPGGLSGKTIAAPLATSPFGEPLAAQKQLRQTKAPRRASKQPPACRHLRNGLTTYATFSSSVADVSYAFAYFYRSKEQKVFSPFSQLRNTLDKSPRPLEEGAAERGEEEGEFLTVDVRRRSGKGSRRSGNCATSVCRSLNNYWGRQKAKRKISREMKSEKEVVGTASSNGVKSSLAASSAD